MSYTIDSVGKIRVARAEGVVLPYCLDCAFILLFWTIPLLFLRPFQNVPFVDDWTYAWPVERLFQYHRLEVLEWSSSPNIIQALWGALFCLRSGFSFGSLCFSTWVSGAACLCGFYLLLRAMKVSRVAAFLGVATLGVNPIFFNLAFTFMTDVPFLALQVWAVLALVRGFETQRRGWFVAAAVLTAFATGIRPVGVALPACVAFLLLARRRKFRPVSGGVLFSIISTVITAAIFAWWHHHQYSTAYISGTPGIPTTRLWWLRFSITSLPQTLPGGVMFILGAIGLGLLPLSFASFERGMLKRWGIVMGLILLSWGAMHLFQVNFTIPLSKGSFWEWNGVGASKEMVPGSVTPGDPPWLFVSMLAAFASAAIFIAVVRYRPKDEASVFLSWLCLVHFGLIVALWLFHDRYALVMLPFAIALFAATRRLPQFKIAVPLLSGFLIISVASVHNTLSYNEALWDGVGRLRNLGVANSEIDGGYVVNGWLQYAHPENAPLDENGRMFVPWITTATRSLKYKISNQQRPGAELVAEIPYGQWLRPGGALYVLRNQP